MAQRSSAHFFSFIAIIIVIVGVIFYVNPRRDEVSSLSATIDGQTVQITSLQAEVDRLNALQTTVSTNAAQTSSLTAAIPSGLQEDAVIKNFTEIAAQNGMTVGAISFSGGATKDLITTFAVNAGLSGKYDDLFDFLKDLESADRQYTVRSISLQLTPVDKSDDDKANDVQMVDFSITMDVYATADITTAS